MRLTTLLLPALAASTSGSVVVIPGGGDPKPYTGPAGLTSEDDLYRQSALNEFYNNTAKLIMSSHSAPYLTTDPRNKNLNLSNSTPGLRPSGDSFVRGAIQAWGEHLHLVIRPEEVWFTILVQMNFYMNRHAEEIRNLFVDHQGQKEILVEDFTWHSILIRFQDEIQNRVKTPWLLDWIQPDFSTTTDNDRMTANILMMGLTKAYFKYSGRQVCGLPSVTLLGEQSDWEKLLAKLDHLADFGKEPTEYRERLKPILSRFVSTFKDPDSQETRDFWNRIVSARAEHFCGAPPVYVSGWITGFWYWNDNGSPFARAGTNGLNMDGVAYPSLDLEFVPVGYARAPFIMKDWDGMDDFPAYVAAGTLGKQITTGPPEGYKEALQRTGGNLTLAEDVGIHGTLRPLSGWMLYGPVDHNATNSRWVGEEELMDLPWHARKFMEGDTCGVRN